MPDNKEPDKSKKTGTQPEPSPDVGRNTDDEAARKIEAQRKDKPSPTGGHQS